MSKLDIVIIIIIALAGFRCLMAGFVRSTMGLISLVAGIFIAGRFWHLLSPYLVDVFKSETWAKWISVVIITIVASTLVCMIIERVRIFAEKGVLNWVNNLIGAAFGVIFASLLLGLILMLLAQHGGDFFQNAINNSKFCPTLVNLAEHAIGMVADKKPLAIFFTAVVFNSSDTL